MDVQHNGEDSTMSEISKPKEQNSCKDYHEFQSAANGFYPTHLFAERSVEQKETLFPKMLHAIKCFHIDINA